MGEWLKRIASRLGRPVGITAEESFSKTVNVPGELEFILTLPFKQQPPGLIFRAYSDQWTGCKGGSGFELGLTTDRLKICSTEGKLIGDMKYTLPFMSADTYDFDVRLVFKKDGVIFSIKPKSSMFIYQPVMLQALTSLEGLGLVAETMPVAESHALNGVKISPIRSIV